MSKLLLSPLTATNLTINNAYALFKTSIEVSEPLKSALGPIETAALVQFIADNDNFGKQINKNQKNPLTDELKVLNKPRIAYWRECKNVVSSFIKSPNDEKRNAAQALDQFMTPYWDADTLPINSKSGTFSEIVAKYKANKSLIAAATVLGISNSFTLLDSANTDYDIVYKKRNDEYAQSEASGSSLKPAAVASYNTFCTAIEQAANLTPNESILSLFRQLDELRKKYHLLQSSGKDTPDPDAPTNGK